MGDTLELFAFLFLIYLSECGCWIDRTSLGIRRSPRRARVVTPPEFLGSDSSGLLVGNPFPFGSRLFVVHQWPVAPGLQAVVPAFPQAIDRRHRLRPPAPAVPYAELGALQADGRNVRRRGARLATAGSPAQAEALARWLASLAELPPSRRGEAIDRRIDASLDVPAIERRLEAFDRETRRTRLGAGVLFAFTFVVAPLVAVTAGLLANSVLLLWFFAALWLATLLAFARAHARLYPAERAGRRGQVALMVFLPLSAMRAVDVLARPLLEDFDPLIVAAVTARERAGEPIRAALRDLRYPVVRAERLADEATRSALAWFRERYVARLLAALAQLGWPAEAADEAPRADADARAFCPRCLGQYRTVEATCVDCGDRELVAFAEDGRDVATGTPPGHGVAWG